MLAEPNRRQCLLRATVAIIWAAVILATAFVLQGTGLMAKMIPILGAGAAGCIIVVSSCPRKSRKE